MAIPKQKRKRASLSLVDEADWLATSFRTERRRPIREFAEAEIVMPPGGLFPGEKFRCRRQPFSNLFLEQVELAEAGVMPWTDFLWTGCTQSGKTTLGLIVMMYALFELKESVIYGIPTSKLASKKWKKDIKPIIEASRYSHLMPTHGPSSQGGSDISAVYFRHGPSLLFMSSGGGREERSSDTARWLIVTEADSFSETDEVGGEGRKIDQLFARTHAFGGRRRAFAECTVTTDEAFTWDTYHKKSSRSEIVTQCEACGEWVRMEREHLVGWTDAKSQIEAGQLARWECPNPECGRLFDESVRQQMVTNSKLIHRGQTIDKDGNIVGEIPQTRMFGFRWNAWDNRLTWTTSFIAEAEQQTKQAKDQDAAGIMLGQFYWATPRESEAVDLLNLEPQTIQERVAAAFPKGLVPADTEILTMGMDIGKRNLHWVVVAMRPHGATHVCDYGMEPVPYDRSELSIALRSAMMSLQERVIRGWPVEGKAVDHRMLPEQVFADSGWGDYADLVYEECRNFGIRWRAIKGFGFGQGKGFGNTSYSAPRGISSTTELIGTGWHLVRLDDQGYQLMHLDANHWKTRLQTAICGEANIPGSFSLFDGTNSQHDEYKRHLCAERARIKQKFVDGKWDVREVWERVGKANHYLDGTCYALAAADFVRFIRELRKPQQQATETTSSPVVMPDGRAFFVGGRT